MSRHLIAILGLIAVSAIAGLSAFGFPWNLPICLIAGGLTGWNLAGFVMGGSRHA